MHHRGSESFLRANATAYGSAIAGLAIDPREESAYAADFADTQWNESSAARLKARAASRSPDLPPDVPHDAAQRRDWLTHLQQLSPLEDGTLVTSKGPLLRLADRFRARRVELGLTRAVLARRAGVPLMTLRRFERTGNLGLASLFLLAIELRIVADLDAVGTRRRPDDAGVLLRRVTLRRRGRAGIAAAPPPR